MQKISNLNFLKIVLIFVTFYPAILFSDTKNKLWNVLTIRGAHGKFLYQIQPQLRLQDRPVLLEQGLLLSEIGYQFTKIFSLSLGQRSGYIDSTPTSLSQKDYGWYLQGQFAFKKKDGLLIFAWTRIEERERLHFSGLYFRGRQRLGFNKDLTKSITLAVYDDVFFNLARPSWIHTSTIAENRFYLGINQSITKKIEIGLGFMNQLIFTHPMHSGQVAVVSLTFTTSKDKYGAQPLEEAGS